MYTQNILKSLSMASSAAIMAALSTHALAQAPAPSANAGKTTATLDEVVVTAQKVSTNLQKTPIAITAISPKQLEDANIRSVIDLDKQVPGLTVTNVGPYPVNITIRGVGYDGLQNNSAQPGVAFVQNGVYIASPESLAASFLDLGQIEVLRGPQGTVNGQNADGGALNVTTVAPILGSFHASEEVSYGSYDYNRERGTINLPIGDIAAVRASAQHDAHGGWIYAPNEPNSNRIDNQDSLSGRVDLLVKPTSRLTFDLWGESFINNTNGLSIRNAFDPASDVRTTSNDYPTPSKVRSRVLAATISYDFDFAKLKSITSYQDVYTNAVNSGDMLSRSEALALYGYKDEEPVKLTTNHSVTEEINLSHTGGRLDWIVGGFYLHTAGNEKYFETQQSSLVRIPYPVSFNPTPAQLAQIDAGGLAFESNSNSHRSSIAGYGQGTFHFTDRLRLTVGARYSSDDYAADTSAFYITPVPLESKFTKVTGKASLEYDVVRNSTVYGSYSTGVKPGGTNLNPESTFVPRSFKYEFVQTYEVGSKNEFFDRTLRLNASGFYNDYSNLQSDSEDPLPYEGGILNIPKSRTYGGEVEGTFKLPEGFRIDANASVMRSEVLSNFSVIDPYTAQIINRDAGGPYIGNDLALRSQAFVNLKGNELGRVPHLSSSISLSKTSEIGELGVLDFYVQGNYRSAYWYRVFNNPAVDRVPHQFIMNFNARFQPAHQPWYAELDVSNLLGSDAVQARYAENFGVGGVFESIVPPRQIIGRVGLAF